VDHTRLAYTKIHSAENAKSAASRCRLVHPEGCGPVQAVMSDNAKCYATSHQFRGTPP
jgi:hypothetical protein